MLEKQSISRKELQDKYGLFFQNMKDAVYVYTLSDDGVISPLIDFNAAAIELLGYTSEEMSQLKVAQIVPEEQRASHPVFATKPEHLTSTIFETIHVTKSGERFPVEVNIVPKEMNGTRLVCSIARNIADRKRMEESIMEEKEKSGRYFSSPGVVFLALDTEGKVTMLNGTGCKLFGYKYAKRNGKSEGIESDPCVAIGLDWFDHFIPESIREELRVFFEDVISGRQGQFEHNENEILCKDGTKRIVNWHNTVLKDTKGKVMGSFSSGMDITERKVVEEKLEQAKTNTALALIEGQEKERQRIAMDLHDSILPLLSTAIRYAENYESNHSTDQHVAVGTPYNVSDLLAKILSEVKAISYNLYPPTLRDFGLVAALKERCDILNSSSDGPEVRFVGHVSKENLSSLVEVNLYRTAQELLNNALKHAGADKITLQLIQHKGSLVMMVEDDGKGMDFQQVKKGLGLSGMIARLKTMNGHCDIDSQIEKGTTITVEVPSVISSQKLTSHEID